MNRRTLNHAALLLAIAALLAPLTASAQDQMMGQEKMMDDSRPIVAIIRADWCSACQKLEPTMAKLQEQYKDRLTFVVLDVSNDEKTAEAAATARKLGISKFFAAHKKKTSTVAIFDAKHKKLFQTDHNADGDAYVRAFDDAIAKAAAMKQS
ncbi:hypothetical protein BH18ACI2_BH18ACI2_14940 [soil metagenome]